MEDKNSNEDNILDYLKMFEHYQKEFEKEMIPPNILICGKTGVGKSTLINAIFRERLAETSSGEPVTMGLSRYKQEEVPITLFDTRGLELKEETRERVKQEITNEIDKRSKSSDVSEHIHIMWYCISNESDRLEPIEEEWIEHFSSRMKVILVLTKTYSQNEKFLSYLEKKNFPVVAIQQVLSEPKEMLGGVRIPVHGLVALVKKTYEHLPDAVKYAFVNAQAVDAETKENEAKKWLYVYLSSSGIAGIIPLGGDILAVWAAQVFMVSHISSIFGLPKDKKFSKGLVKAVTGGMLGASGPKGLLLASEKIAAKLGKEGLKQIFKNSNVFVRVLSAGTSVVATLLIGNSYISACKRIITESSIDQLSSEEIQELLTRVFEEEYKRNKEIGLDDEENK